MKVPEGVAVGAIFAVTAFSERVIVRVLSVAKTEGVRRNAKAIYIYISVGS
ncbi:hypothetical protein IJH23_03195 [Candidatus Saccharibacteria bacterium]|nr:hypothetical protein [Candidatus Saccharibacteria bacterium]